MKVDNLAPSRTPHSSSPLRCRHIFVPLLFLLLASFAVRSERLPIKVYTTADGLTNNRVSRIVRDSHGYLWFCTENGLSRFDGQRFTNYTTDQGLADNEVDDLLETRSGTYWVATGRGLCRYNPRGFPQSKEVTSLESDAMFVVCRPGGDQLASAIKSLYEDKEGRVWVGTWRGLYRADVTGKEVRLEHVDLAMPAKEPQGQVVRNILEDHNGALWLATSSGLYRRSPDGTVDRFTKQNGLAGETLLGLVEDSRGRLWVGDRSGGLCALVANPQRGKDIVERRYNVADGLGCPAITCLSVSAEGSLWIGTDCGLFEFIEDSVSSHGKIRMALAARELSDPRVWSMAEDIKGNIWLGTADGAVKVARGGFSSYSEADGLGSRTACSTIETSEGELLVFTRGLDRTFLNRFDKRRFVSVKLNLPSEAKTDICPSYYLDREGRLWIAAGVVLRFPRLSSIEELSRVRPELMFSDAGSNDPILAIHEDQLGNIWLATQGTRRLMKWDQHRSALVTYTEADGLPPPGTLGGPFVEDAKGDLWISFAEAGLVRYSNDHFELFTSSNLLPAGTIRSLLIDKSGRLWVACSQGGLARIDDPGADKPVAKIYTIDDGLSSNRVRSLVEDNEGRIYVGTDQSLDRLEPATGSVKHFGVGDGLVNNLILDGFRDHDGSLWFATDTGVSRLVPTPEQAEPPPTVLINGLNIAGNRSSISELGENSISEMELAPNQNSVGIDFTAIAFGTGDLPRYQHRLEGADNEWSAPSTQRSVSFASLAPGRYRFLVRAVNANGVTSQAASFSFTVMRPVWQRWWFVTIAGLILASAIYGAYRYRLLRLIELERVRTRIAADLHDDIGANLSLIAMASEVVQRRPNQDDPHVVDALTLISTTSREMVDSMSDIVWAVNPGKDHLTDLVKRIRRFASDALTARGIALRFSGPSEDGDVKLGTETRRDVLMILKEGVNNIARHSNCTEAEIQLRTHGGWLSLNLRDNGRGFDETDSLDGNGLMSMRQRAERLSGKLEVISRPGGGTLITLKVPLR